jgi:diguanylate cyclase (GGDEF)-like protein
MQLKRDFVRRLNRAILISFSIFLVAIAGYFYMAASSQFNAISVVLESVRGTVDAGIWSSLSAGIGEAYFLFLMQLSTFVIGFVALLLAFRYTAHKYSVEKRDALMDSLTKLYNRRAVFFELKRELRKTERFNHPTSVAMVDLDFFKKYNDINGHVAGDRLLRRFGRILKESVREFDIVGRFGGEEFIIIFPETSLKDASKVCERVRETVEATKFHGQEKMPNKRVTVSIGIAEVPPKRKMKRDTIVRKADEKLYEAKSTGRNQVISA